MVAPEPCKSKTGRCASDAAINASTIDARPQAKNRFLLFPAHGDVGVCLAAKRCRKASTNRLMEASSCSLSSVRKESFDGANEPIIVALRLPQKKRRVFRNADHSESNRTLDQAGGARE